MLRRSVLSGFSRGAKISLHMAELSHFRKDGSVRMVDVSGEPFFARTPLAVADPWQLLPAGLR